MTWKEEFDAAQEIWFSDGLAETITYNGTDIYGHVEDGAGFVRNEASVASVSLNIRVRRSDVSQPAVDDIVVYDGVQYRVGEGFYLSGGDWVISLIIDYIEV